MLSQFILGELYLRVLMEQQMNTVEEIYTKSYKRYVCKLNKILESANLALSVESLIYHRCYSHGGVLALPLLVNDSLSDYYTSPEADKRIFLDFETLLLSPTINDVGYKNAVYQSHNNSFCVDHILTKEVRHALPWHLHYHHDYSISFLCIFLKKKDALIANKLFYGGHFRQLHQALDQLVSQNTMDIDLDAFTFKNVNPSKNLLTKFIPTPQFSELTYTENLCFLAIYNGHYEVKALALCVGRSPRTIEGLIASMVQKLRVNNRYELFVKISQSHEHRRYLAYINYMN